MDFILPRPEIIGNLRYLPTESLSPQAVLFAECRSLHFPKQSAKIEHLCSMLCYSDLPVATDRTEKSKGLKWPENKHKTKTRT